MTVAQLIELLMQLPQHELVYRNGGDYADDWRLVRGASALSAWGYSGVLIE